MSKEVGQVLFACVSYIILLELILLFATNH